MDSTRLCLAYPCLGALSHYTLPQVLGQPGPSADSPTAGGGRYDVRTMLGPSVMKIGVQLSSLRQPLRTALDTVARWQVDGVEIDARGELQPATLTQTGLRQIRRLLDDRGLKVCAVSFRTRRGYDVAADLSRRVEATKGAIDFAHQLGAPLVINHVADIGAARTDGPTWDMLLQVLHELGAYGQRHGALLAADTGADSPEDLSHLLSSLPAGSLLVNLNPGNLIVGGFSPLAAIHSCRDHIAHVHAQDGVRDRSRGRGSEVPLGQGTADFPELIGALEEINYRGFFTATREASLQPSSDLVAAVQFLRALLP